MVGRINLICILLASVAITKCDELRLQINFKKPQNTVAAEFVSLALDSKDLQQLEDENE